VCDEFFADFGWACSHTVQTVVAHIKELLVLKPPIVQYYQKRHCGRINSRTVPLAFWEPGDHAIAPLRKRDVVMLSA
jgi:hypothetical protein